MPLGLIGLDPHSRASNLYQKYGGGLELDSAAAAGIVVLLSR